MEWGERMKYRSNIKPQVSGRVPKSEECIYTGGPFLPSIYLSLVQFVSQFNKSFLGNFVFVRKII